MLLHAIFFTSYINLNFFFFVNDNESQKISFQQINFNFIINFFQIGTLLHYSSGQEGQYFPDDSGQYRPDNSGQYIPDNSGQYSGPPPQPYQYDDRGRWIPDNRGLYMHIEG